MSWSLVTQRRDESGQLSSRFIAEGRSLICGLRLKPSPGAASGVLPARQLALSVERCLYQLSVPTSESGEPKDFVVTSALHHSLSHRLQVHSSSGPLAVEP